MSAAQKKTKHNSDGFDIGKSSKNNSKKNDSSKKTAKIAGITAAVIAVLYAASLFINSNYFRQTYAALTIDNVKYSITDFNYYFENVYMQFYQTMSSSGEFGSSMLPDQNSSLKDQIYDEATGETWSDFFENMALEQMKADNEIYVEALKAGYQLPEDEKTKMETDFDNFKTMSYASGYTNFSDYLKAAYGRSMTEAEYKENSERSYLISSYTNYKHDSFQYTPDQIEAYYAENKDVFDTFTYRYFHVSAAEVKEADYADTAAYETAKAAAIEAAGVKANEYVAKITDEQSFIMAAREYDPETNKEDTATERVYKGELLGDTYGAWLRDASRQSGDVTAIEMTNGYYVVFFESRDNNHYPTVNVQQILVPQETVDKTQFTEEDNDAAYNAAVETAKKTAEDTANKINQEWLDGGATQDKLTELMTSHSSEISTTDSKLSENVYRNQMPAEVNSWLYDTARKPGDHTVIYNEATGYYILNYIGTGRQYSDVLSETKKRDKDLQAWQDSLTGGEVKMTWLMSMTKG